MKISAYPRKVITMKLRRPQETLANCCWLARMVDKVRAAEGPGFPFLYRLSLGSPIGIDGFFLRHFNLSFRAFRKAILESRTDENLATWFLAQPGITPQRIAAWNGYGPKLGTPGYPGSVFKHLAKWVVYRKLLNHPVDSFFEMIEQDEAS